MLLAPIYTGSASKVQISTDTTHFLWLLATASNVMIQHQYLCHLSSLIRIVTCDKPLEHHFMMIDVISQVSFGQVRKRKLEMRMKGWIRWHLAEISSNIQMLSRDGVGGQVCNQTLFFKPLGNSIHSLSLSE